MAGLDSSTEKIMIYIDADLADRAESGCRYRMTVAEELAHVLIHRPAIEAIKCPNDFSMLHKHSNWYTYERNAKRLAAALLMPARHLGKDARDLYAEIIEKLPEQYKYTQCDAIKSKLTALLAKRYEVSVQSMGIRLKEWPIQILNKIDQAMKNRLPFLE